MRSLLYLCVLLLVVISAFLYCESPKRSASCVDDRMADTVQVISYRTPVYIPKFYGFPIDSFSINEGVVARNQNLASILLAQQVDYSVIHHLVEKSREFFDVRRIRAGNSYYLLSSKEDTTRQAEWFIYDISRTDYLVMQLTDSLNVYLGEKPIEIVHKSGAGKIHSSLWNAMVAQDMNPLLAIELSDIYAWTVDFFGIEAGDSFKVFYQEAYVDSQSIGISSIDAAYFSHRGEAYYAFYYETDSTACFFDEKGQSLRKAFLRAPLKYSRISSHFSNSRFHPVLRIYRPHHGIDYAAPAGTPVYTIGDGTVIARGWDSRGGGNYVRIRHNSVYTTLYMHLQGFARGLAVGQRVRQGDLIGYVGQTGLATGPHLDFRVFKNGQPINPLRVESPPVEPVPEHLMEAFMEDISLVKEALDRFEAGVESLK